ncbi:MAG: hypothetical protein C4532_10725 [Candidatus Abyssobacteria bacterium SURF_17]|uniref:Uncharacterized protein n=1 Tax=Candidatus Abyssobacteria bacterium SURF_17 TaxID=2093361 RepID=A0A419EXN4_9BACT|nr:MAG: hypothetical protein C4532_10725 [Candidatus Abyssubacteria bacterium SURF_17]
MNRQKQRKLLWLCLWRQLVKLENFSYSIAMKTLELLEKQYHYKISDSVKREIAEAVVQQLDSFIEA